MSSSLPSQLIQKGTKLVLEQVVTSIASVADTAEEKFVPYYDLFMPSLKHIVENAVQKELRLLRGKTIECISLIGLAVGKEKVRLHGGCDQTSQCRLRLPSSHLSSSSCCVTSSCRMPRPSCSCSSKPRPTSMTWRTTILRLVALEHYFEPSHFSWLSRCNIVNRSSCVCCSGLDLVHDLSLGQDV